MEKNIAEGLQHINKAAGICQKCGDEYFFEYGCQCDNDLKRVDENAHKAYHKAKFDAGKPRFDLIDPHFELDLAKILEVGVRNHGENAWKTVPNAIKRFKGAIRRHLNAIDLGEYIDEPSGLPHTACVSANSMFLSYFLRLDHEITK